MRLPQSRIDGREKEGKGRNARPVEAGLLRVWLTLAVEGDQILIQLSSSGIPP